MKSVLVTGGAGYIGTVLTDELLKKGFRVTCLDRFFFGKEKVSEFAVNPNYKMIQGDVRTFDKNILKDIDVIVDMAALSNDPLGELVKNETLDINHKGRARVCKLAKEMGVKQYVLFSSCSVYGFNDDWCTEETKPNPITTYAKANVLAEDNLKLADENFTVTALRFATVFGVSYRMRFDLAINIMTLKAFKEGTIFVLGQGMQWRPFVHTRDASKAVISVIEADKSKVNGEIFNVGANSNNMKVINLAYTIRETLPFNTHVDIAPDDADRRSYKVEFGKIASVLDFKPSFSIEDGINEVYRALKEGKVWDYPDTVTIKWYKYLLNANKLLKDITINGEVL